MKLMYKASELAGKYYKPREVVKGTRETYVENIKHTFSVPMYSEDYQTPDKLHHAITNMVHPFAAEWISHKLSGIFIDKEMKTNLLGNKYQAPVADDGIAYPETKDKPFIISNFDVDISKVEGLKTSDFTLNEDELSRKMMVLTNEKIPDGILAVAGENYEEARFNHYYNIRFLVLLNVLREKYNIDFFHAITAMSHMSIKGEDIIRALKWPSNYFPDSVKAALGFSNNGNPPFFADFLSAKNSYSPSTPGPFYGKIPFYRGIADQQVYIDAGKYPYTTYWAEVYKIDETGKNNVAPFDIWRLLLVEQEKKINIFREEVRGLLDRHDAMDATILERPYSPQLWSLWIPAGTSLPNKHNSRFRDYAQYRENIYPNPGLKSHPKMDNIKLISFLHDREEMARYWNNMGRHHSDPYKKTEEDMDNVILQYLSIGDVGGGDMPSRILPRLSMIEESTGEELKEYQMVDQLVKALVDKINEVPATDIVKRPKTDAKIYLKKGLKLGFEDGYTGEADDYYYVKMSDVSKAFWKKFIQEEDSKLEYPYYAPRNESETIKTIITSKLPKLEEFFAKNGIYYGEISREEVEPIYYQDVSDDDFDEDIHIASFVGDNRLPELGIFKSSTQAMQARYSNHGAPMLTTTPTTQEVDLSSPMGARQVPFESSTYKQGLPDTINAIINNREKLLKKTFTAFYSKTYPIKLIPNIPRMTKHVYQHGTAGVSNPSSEYKRKILVDEYAASDATSCIMLPDWKHMIGDTEDIHPLSSIFGLEDASEDFFYNSGRSSIGQGKIPEQAMFSKLIGDLYSSPGGNTTLTMFKAINPTHIKDIVESSYFYEMLQDKGMIWSRMPATGSGWNYGDIYVGGTVTSEPYKLIFDNTSPRRVPDSYVLNLSMLMMASQLPETASKSIKKFLVAAVSIGKPNTPGHKYKIEINRDQAHDIVDVYINGHSCWELTAYQGYGGNHSINISFRIEPVHNTDYYWSSQQWGNRVNVDIEVNGNKFTHLDSTDAFIDAGDMDRDISKKQLDLSLWLLPHTFRKEGSSSTPKLDENMVAPPVIMTALRLDKNPYSRYPFPEDIDDGISEVKEMAGMSRLDLLPYVLNSNPLYYVPLSTMYRSAGDNTFILGPGNTGMQFSKYVSKDYMASYIAKIGPLSQYYNRAHMNLPMVKETGCFSMHRDWKEI